MELMSACRFVQVIRFQILKMFAWIAKLFYLIAKYAKTAANVKNVLMDFIINLIN